MQKINQVLLAALCLCVSMANAQIVKDTIWVPVTYYDFHSDGSNPEFQSPNPTNIWGVNKNMVGPNLDVEGKPVLGPTPYYDNYVKYWFRDWSTNVKNKDFTKPVYNNDGTLLRIDNVTYDTAFKNLVIHDSLPFVRLQDNSGRYQYDNQSFFPLDRGPGYGKRNPVDTGFGSEGRSHNYSFAMELKWKFQKKSTQTFDFTGDDDVWAFVNGIKEMDLGGIHLAQSDHFSMSDFPDIKENAVCTLSVFYCERKTDESHIKITTNIISLPIDSLDLKVTPNSSICAGDTLFVTAKFRNDTGVVKQLSPKSTLTWGLIDKLNLDTTLSHKVNDTVSRFIPTEAYDTAKIWCEYYNPDDNIRKKDTVTITINACHADHMVIEASSDSLLSLRNDKPLDTIRIGASQQTNSGMYAILRDKYGNWVKPADSSSWTSANTQAITVTGGPNLLRGQGTVHRSSADTGVSVVTSTYIENGKTYKDNIVAVVNNITYTKIRLVVINGGQAVPVDSISMRTKEDTTLIVQGLRSDDGKTWEKIPAHWNPVNGMVLDPTVPTDSSESYTFIPRSTGRVTIGVTKGNPAGGQPLAANVTLIVTHGDPDHMLLFDAPGDPKTMKQLPDSISIVAGTSQRVDAKLFDNNNEWLDEFEKVDSLSNRIKWTLSDKVNAGISSTQGHEILFTSTVTGTYVLTAQYNAGSISLTRLLTIVVRPGKVKMLVIEPNKDGNTLSPHKPQIFQDSTIVLTSEQKSQLAYAVLRDEYGNWVGYSRKTEWKIDKAIASLTKLNEIYGEVLINRIDSGLAVIHASDLDSGVTGSAKLHILNYYYKKLRIVVKQKIASKDTLVHIDSLLMKSDKDSLLYVIGQRSDDTARWEQTTANWLISSPLSGVINPAMNVGNYHVTPKDTGSGWIRVSNGDDAKTIPDTVNVKFIQPDPVHAQIQIITPATNRIAGDTMIAVVKIFDSRDKLIPGPKCLVATYQDSLGKKGIFEPTVTIDSVTDTINSLVSTAHSASECFNGGVDTIKIVLYNAPVAPDSVHKIFVHLNSLPVAYTESFHLKPGKIDRLDIENANGSSVEDTVVLSAPGGSKMFYAAGFDRFGNRISEPSIWPLLQWTNSNWSVSGNLNPVNGKNVGQIYYETGSVKVNESGFLTAAAADTSAPFYVKDSVFIKVVGPAINLARAITRDIDGNGYLDHIELHFALPVTLPANFSFSGLSITNGSTIFTATGIENNTGRTDSVWSIKINEVQNNIPQTAWKPYISFDRNDAVSIAGVTKAQCQDGAGPVVWYVENKLGKAPNHTEDVVTVTLSELVMRSSGSSLAFSDTPSVVFNVWEKNKNDSFVIVDKILVGINNFTSVTTTTKDPKQTVVSFKMTNTNDLTTHYFMNINTSKMYISDNAQPQNLPNINNQKVKVNVVPNDIHPVPFPNPAQPEAGLVSPGELSAEHNPAARSYIKSGHGGTITTITVYLPPDGIKVRCYRKIYDAVGNLVNQAKTEDFLNNIPTDVTSYPIDLYWNEYTAQKNKAAPGVYMEVLYIEYYASPQANVSNDQVKIFNDKIQQGQYPFVIMHGVSR